MLIRVDNLSFAYGDSIQGNSIQRDSIQALQNISFEIAAGELVALTGHNGSGKSTLVKHLNGLLKPSAGTAWINDTDTSTIQPAELASTVALLFQNPDNQICKKTVWEEVAFGPQNLGYSSEKIQSNVVDALTQFDLLQYKQHNPHDCGYSIRKRIAIASIVAMDTPVLVFDEPTAGLDPYEVSLLIATVHKLQNRNKTILIISHDMDFVAENFTRVLSLNNGKITFDDSVRKLFNEPELMKKCGLQQPQVMQICTALGIGGVALNPHECVAKIEKKIEDDPL